MASKATFQRMTIGGIKECLVPTDDDGRELVMSIKSGKTVMVTVHAPRNPAHHRMLFLLFKKLQDGGVWEGDIESLLDWMKYGAGHVSTTIDHNGNTHYVPKSIAFESMDQAKFSRFFNRVCYLVFHRLLDGQGDGWEALRDEIISIVEGDLPERRQ